MRLPVFAKDYSLGEQESLARALAFAAAQAGNDELGQAVTERALETAEILAAMRLDEEALIAAILCATRSQQELHERFGVKVTQLVEGVTRIGHAVEAGFDDPTQLEVLRKMLLAMVEDIRVVLIRLALHTQALRDLCRRQREDLRLARQALEIYAPLANRLGVRQLKWELEDLGFQILSPERYQHIMRLLDEERTKREAYIARVSAQLNHELQRHHIFAQVTGRPKHIYSIHMKMQQKQLTFEQVHDVRALRILVHSVADCYAALALLHDLWSPIAEEFDDYIVRPKSNGYRSLHTALVGPEGEVLEVQIRTQEMHHDAELGVAAHWRYKEGQRRNGRYDEKIAWLRQILEWRDDLADKFKLVSEALQDQVYVFTPKGQVIALSREATPLDFAYHVHTELGHRCRGAKVDGAMVPLNYRLSHGQRVEIIAAKEGGPSLDWLNPAGGYLKSAKARAKVRHWFNVLNLAEDTARGRAAVERELVRRNDIKLAQLAQWFNFHKADDFFAAIGRGEISRSELRNALQSEPEKPPQLEKRNQSEPVQEAILIAGEDKLLTVIAKCCNPSPPDPIIGCVTRGRGVKVHHASCHNVGRISRERLIAADWARTGTPKPKRSSVSAVSRLARS